MIDAKKLNNTIDELGKQVNDLKSISEIYKKLNELKGQIDLQKESYKQVAKEIREVSKTIKENSISNIDTTDEFEDMMTSIRKNFQEDMNSIKVENSNFNKEIAKEYKSINGGYLERLEKYTGEVYRELSKLKDEINLEQEQYGQVIQEIKDASNTLKSEYRQYFIDLEKMQLSHLERNKSDISVEIRQGSSDIERVLGNNIDSRFIEFYKKTSEESKALEKNYELLLEKSKSETIKQMQQLIKDDGDILSEHINLRFIELEKNLSERYKQGEMNINKINKLMIALLGLSGIVAVVSLISLI